jgi:hypothetical protein
MDKPSRKSGEPARFVQFPNRFFRSSAGKTNPLHTNRVVFRENIFLKNFFSHFWGLLLAPGLESGMKFWVRVGVIASNDEKLWGDAILSPYIP